MKILNTFAGSQINQVINNAIEQAADCSNTVQFEFNGVTVQVREDSNPDLIYREWQRGMLRNSNGAFVVSPYPPAEVSAEDLAEDAALQKAIDDRHAKRRAEYEDEQAKKKASFKEATSGQTIQLSDEVKWRHIVAINSKNDYSAACVRYAENWALLMQAKIENGAKLQDIAEQASFDADTEGITGFMYGAAVSMLAEYWIHGEELRQWHNLETQIGTEGEKANLTGGVLNPALLHIG